MTKKPSSSTRTKTIEKYLLGLPVEEIISTVHASYSKTPIKLKVLDIFAASSLTTALLLFLYALVAGTFPFNGFLAGFFCCVGSFVLTVSLRLQCSQETSFKFSEERAFVDYVLAMTVLFLASWTYIG